MPSVSMSVSRGCATGIDPSLLDPGQLQESVGVVYNVSDPAAHKMGGRTLYNSTPIAASAVDSLLWTDTVGMVALCGGNYYTSSGNGSWTLRYSPGSSALVCDGAILNDRMAIVQGGGPIPNNFVMESTGVFRRLGLSTTDSSVLVASPGVGGALTGTYEYWATEYDSTYDVESAVTDPDNVNIVAPAGQKVNLTVAGAVWSNASADKYRIYRTIAGDVFPNGWLVVEQVKATTTYLDNTTDAVLVTADAYPIVTINDVPESRNWFNDSGFCSIDTFQGSMVAVINGSDSIYYSESGLMDSWPQSYRLRMTPIYGGSTQCVRTMGDSVYVMFQHEMFRVHYLPKASDAVFDTGIAQEKIANYGTPSHRGACVFTGHGNRQAMFVASLNGPMVMVDGVIDRAVSNIDWRTIVPASHMALLQCIDNPDRQRVEMSFVDTDGDWSALHFYYDSERLTQKTGPLPELAWTGPHKIPGPLVYTVFSNTPAIYSASKATGDGSVYHEDSGTVDAALLIDSDGTVQFRLRTGKMYPVSVDGEARAERLHIHKGESGAVSGAADYTVTFNAHREESGSVACPLFISAETPGMTSTGVNKGFRGFDVRVVYDGVTAMPPINNMTLRLEDAEPFTKTTRA